MDVLFILWSSDVRTVTVPICAFPRQHSAAVFSFLCFLIGCLYYDLSIRTINKYSPSKHRKIQLNIRQHIIKRTMHLAKGHSKKLTRRSQVQSPTEKRVPDKFERAKWPLRILVGEIPFHFPYDSGALVDEIYVKFYIVSDEAYVWIVWVAPL